VLVGHGVRAAYEEWLSVQSVVGTCFEGTLETTAREACEHASANPRALTAIATTRDQLDAWRDRISDRFSAMVEEGVVELSDETRDARVVSRAAKGAVFCDARSAAEAALFEALETTPATMGRFKLNEYLSVRFGGVACEVDILSREERIAVEIDGYHHFTDLDAYRRDREKDVLLQSQGLFVIRVLAEDVMRDPRDAVNAVCQALAYRRDER
jgi:very-short-patch-repair endonuclease